MASLSSSDSKVPLHGAAAAAASVYYVPRIEFTPPQGLSPAVAAGEQNLDVEQELLIKAEIFSRAGKYALKVRLRPAGSARWRGSLSSKEISVLWSASGANIDQIYQDITTKVKGLGSKIIF